MNYKEIFKRLNRLIPLVIMILLIPLVMSFLKVDRENIAIAIALELGILGILQVSISELFFSPLFSYSIREVVTSTKSGETQKYYHLTVKNYGFTSAKNIKVKIKDGENKSWINLTLPFRNALEERDEDTACMKNLSPEEENQFDIGFIGLNDNFLLMVNISPYNQKIMIKKGEKQSYFLEITADNANPCRFRIHIENEGYHSFLIRA